jgi:hypothetical protein
MAIVKKTLMAVAIEMLGGLKSTAEVVGIDIRTMRKLLEKPVGKWKGGYVFASARATGIPFGIFCTETLVYPEPETKANPCAERPRLRRVA